MPNFGNLLHYVLSYFLVRIASLWQLFLFRQLSSIVWFADVSLCYISNIFVYIRYLHIHKYIFVHIYVKICICMNICIFEEIFWSTQPDCLVLWRLLLFFLCSILPPKVLIGRNTFYLNIKIKERIIQGYMKERNNTRCRNTNIFMCC